MTEKYRGPRVVPEMTEMERHTIGWWVSIVATGLVCWAVVFVSVLWVLKR